MYVHVQVIIDEYVQRVYFMGETFCKFRRNVAVRKIISVLPIRCGQSTKMQSTKLLFVKNHNMPSICEKFYREINLLYGMCRSYNSS